MRKLPMLTIKEDDEPLLEYHTIMTSLGNRSMYYDKQGKPLNNVLEWATLIEDREYQRVAADCVGYGPNKKWISTVWLGLDHNWGVGPPLIFETMMFIHGHGGWEERASTEEQARIIHAEMVAKYKYNRRQRRRYEAQRPKEVKGPVQARAD